MNQLPDNRKPMNHHKNFRLGIIFSKQGVMIVPQGKLYLSYAQLISAITFLTVSLTPAIAMLSKFGLTF